MKKYHFLVVFGSFGYFLQSFGQVMEWLILQLHEILRVLLAMSYEIIFTLFYD